jgi:ABC-type transporter Mla MlaB component
VNTPNSGSLKITIANAPTALTLRLEGKASGAMVEELRRSWSTLYPELGNRQLVVDLRDVLYVDKAGLEVLADIHRQTGAKFEANSPLTQYFAEQAMRIEDQTRDAERRMK